jgi:uncharacterized phiE125 gp8 family phage protein
MGIFTPFTWNNLPQRGLRKKSESEATRTWLVSLSEAKEHLRVLHSDDDTYIQSLIYASQMTCETFCNIDFTPQDWEFTCDLWEQTLQIPVQRVRTITSIAYYSDASPSVQTVWPTSSYYLDSGSMPCRITLEDGKTYPSLRNGTGNIVINFSTDNLDTGFSSHAKQAVLITIADWYENRQSVVVGRIASQIPKTAEYLMSAVKVQTL